MDFHGLRMRPGKHLDEFFVRFVVQIDESVVAVFVKILVESERRIVLPHEIVVSDHERERQHRLEEHLRSDSSFVLGFEALTAAICAGKAGIERREAPFSHQNRLPARHFVELAQRIRKRRLCASGKHDSPVQIRPGIDVHADDVAMAAAGGENLARVAETREAASENHMVWVSLANCGAHGRKVAFSHQCDELALERGIDAVLRVLCRPPFLERLPRAVFRRERGDQIV